MKSISDIALGAALTEAQAAEIYKRGREAVIFALLEMAKMLTQQTTAQFLATAPATPSGMKPGYAKMPVKTRSKTPGREKGHPGSRRAPPERIDRREEHRLPCCPDCGGKLILDNGGASSEIVVKGENSIETPVELHDALSIDTVADSILNISGQIGEAGGPMPLGKSGPGTLILSGSNTYTGSTTISDGVLELSASGQISKNSTIFTDAPAVLQFNGGEHIMGDIRGDGSTSVISGQLTADSIVQGILTIGAGAKIIIAPRSNVGSMALKNIQSIPEPSTLALLAVGGIVLMIFGQCGRKGRA